MRNVSIVLCRISDLVSFVSPEFPTTRMEMEAVADIFDQDGDGYIDYKEFITALRPDRDVSDSYKTKLKILRIPSLTDALFSNNILTGSSSQLVCCLFTERWKP